MTRAGIPDSWPPPPPNGNGNGGPWWYRAVERFGVLAAFAAFLLWYVTLGPGNDRTLADTLNRHVTETQFYLRAICLNTAQSDNQRAACEPHR